MIHEKRLKYSTFVNHRNMNTEQPNKIKQKTVVLYTVSTTNVIRHNSFEARCRLLGMHCLNDELRSLMG